MALAVSKSHDGMCIDLIEAGAESDWAALLKLAEKRDMQKLAAYIKENKLKVGGSIRRKTRRQCHKN